MIQKSKIAYCIFLTIICLIINTFCQAQESQRFRIGFYNLENFFDPFVDSTKSYNEFTEDGLQHWNYSRFIKKRNNIFKTIHAIGQKESVSLLGFCELENAFVLKELLYNTPLKKTPYQFIHYDSPDRRGIDAAIIYRKDQMRLLYSRPIPLIDPNDSTFRSRDILYAKFEIDNDTLHVFVNHWPSRYGGELESLNRRILAAQTVREQIDSLCLTKQIMPKIILMGDFNDCPTDRSLADFLEAKPINSRNANCGLVNLFLNADSLGFKGTLKHQYQWQIFDQIIVSNTLLDNDNRLIYKQKSAHIFNAPFLFEEDERNLGEKLFRTYVGPKYFGGFSDHLPVYIDLIKTTDSIR